MYVNNETLLILLSYKLYRIDIIDYGVLWQFLPLFQPNFLFNSAFEKDSSDLVLRQLKLGTNI
jgi:hypothetical protein